MYPVIRHEKRHPDGSMRRYGRGYLLEPIGEVTRMYVPAGSRLVHVNGIWIPETNAISLFCPTWLFVPHFVEDAEDPRFYIDMARDVTIGDEVVSFIDLYVDIGISKIHGVTDKDDELLVRLSDGEAAQVRERRDEMLQHIALGDPLFDASSPLWHVPDEARALPPLAAETV